MFDSIKNWLNRTDRHQADRQKLEAEAKDFRLPSETLLQIFKYLFFAGLGFLNYRLFSHAVPGLWGQATGIVAVMAEAIALYAAHNFSRSAGIFRFSLGASGFVLMAFSMIHGTFSILDLIGVADVSAAVQYYSRIVAFPLLAGLLGVSVVAITMTHPKNIIRLKPALAHTAIVVGRAKAASDGEPTSVARASPAPSSVEPPAQEEPSQPQHDAETSAAEVAMTGTDGARILPFSLAPREPDSQSSGAGNEAETNQSSSARTSPTPGQSSSARTFPANKPSVGFLGISQGRVWRPKVYVRNPNYPRVTAVGCYFVEHSGGYQLIHTNTNKYLGHYTMAAISELEKKYAKKKRSSRSRKRK